MKKNISYFVILLYAFLFLGCQSLKEELAHPQNSKFPIVTVNTIDLVKVATEWPNVSLMNIVINDGTERTCEFFDYNSVIVGTWKFSNDTLFCFPSAQYTTKDIPFTVEFVDYMNMNYDNCPQTFKIDGNKFVNISDHKVLNQCLWNRFLEDGSLSEEEKKNPDSFIKNGIIPRDIINSNRNYVKMNYSDFYNSVFRKRSDFKKSVSETLMQHGKLRKSGRWGIQLTAIYRDRLSQSELLLKSEAEIPNVYIKSTQNYAISISGQWNVYGDTLVLNPQLEYRCENGRYSFVSLDTVPDVRNEAVERYLIKKNKLLNISDTARVRRALERLPWKPTCLGGNSYKFRK